jgi:hypothetical protein
MAFNKEIKSCLEQMEELENIFQKTANRLAELKQHLLALEAVSRKEETTVPHLLIKDNEKKEEKETPPVTFLGDKIIKTIYTDLKKSLSLNDRFRFQRDLFGNDTKLMDNTLDNLNDLSSLQETMDYLHNRFVWNEKDESVIAFKEILEKRFV